MKSKPESRSGIESERRGSGNVPGIIAAVVIASVGPVFLSTYYIHLASLVFIYIMATSSLRIVYVSGQSSLGHAAFMAIGAYTSAMLAKHLGWNPWCTMPLGAITAMVCGILIGFPFSRLRAIYFSMASLFFGIMVTNMVGLAPELTGSWTGLARIPRLFGYSRIPYYYTILILTLITLLVLYRIENSRLGMTLKSVAQSHLAASSKGINEAGIRILALGIGAFFAGLAGGAYAHYAGLISPATFGVMPSILLYVYLLAGGKRSFAGPIVGTGVLYLVPYIMGDFKGYAPYFQAGVIVAVTFLVPDGMTSLFGRAASRIREVRKRLEASRYAS
jgi:branched-chain amino acid transport system permease protein